MKKFKIAIICLMILSFVVVGVSFAFLEEVIPIHFGIDGKPDQYGSKYFMLIFPLFSTIVGVTMLLVNKYGKNSDNYNKYMLLVGVLIECVFIVLSVYMSVYAYQYNSEIVLDASKIFMPLMGAMFILMGNFMPKIEKNRTLGFKIYWSMYNEVTWQKTHRFGGFVMVVGGILTILAGIFFKEMVNFIILMILLLILIVSTTIVSYIYYKEEKAKEQ